MSDNRYHAGSDVVYWNGEPVTVTTTGGQDFTWTLDASAYYEAQILAYENMTAALGLAKKPRKPYGK